MISASYRVVQVMMRTFGGMVQSRSALSSARRVVIAASGLIFDNPGDTSLRIWGTIGRQSAKHSAIARNAVREGLDLGLPVCKQPDFFERSGLAAD